MLSPKTASAKKRFFYAFLMTLATLFSFLKPINGHESVGAG
jgi:hypothetical protein